MLPKWMHTMSSLKTFTWRGRIYDVVYATKSEGDAQYKVLCVYGSGTTQKARLHHDDKTGEFVVGVLQERSGNG